jgi:delta14-sterol reductase
MLVFGDYVFIPFVFSIQCHYLINYPDCSILVLVPMFMLYVGGYWLFRAANSQKNQFKQNPQLPIAGQSPKVLGGKLLCSGLWGKARHINYTGDLIMSLCYCLPCGVQVGGYFYAIYLFTLLTHRAYRDDTKCRQKYGALWDEYLKTVPYLFVPIEGIDAPLRAMGRALYGLTNA